MEIIGEACSSDELVAIFRSRKDALGLSDVLVDELGLLGSGHTGKLLGPNPVRRLGSVSLDSFLGVFALKLIVVIDPAQVSRIGKRWQPRDNGRARMANYSLAQAREISARKAVKIRWAKASPRQRHEHMAMMRSRRVFTRKEK